VIPGEDLRDRRLAARLAGRVAHDLNNVAVVLAGHVYLLREGAEPIEEGLAEIERATEQIRTLTGSLLALAAIGRGTEEAFDPNAVAREAATALSPAAELLLDPAAGKLFGRGEDVRRAIDSLIANAREASPPDAPIRISTVAGTEAVEIRVEDSGAGIAPGSATRIFDPLFSTSGSRGRGIGLTIASLVAAVHGGTCELESISGGGTRAILRLRRASRVDPAPTLSRTRP
jgi:signal transduction histidine kinase